MTLEEEYRLWCAAQQQRDAYESKLRNSVLERAAQALLDALTEEFGLRQLGDLELDIHENVKPSGTIKVINERFEVSLLGDRHNYWIICSRSNPRHYFSCPRGKLKERLFREVYNGIRSNAGAGA